MSEEYRARRARRYDGLQVLWSLSSLARVRRCRRARVATGEGVSVALRDGVAHYSGLQTCGSVHACPVCSPRIRAARAVEIETALAFHLAGGGGAEFVTLTLPHDQGDELAPLWDALSLAFKRVLGGRGWQADRDEYGVVGTIRAVEVTYGEAGWHPHLHVLFLTAGRLETAERALLAERLAGRWRASVVASGYRCPSEAHGVTISAVTGASDVSSYTAKVLDDVGRPRALGNELTRHDLKAGRRKGRNPFAILSDFLEGGDTADLALWREYEKASKGRKALAWSRGLKVRLAVAEVTDDELAAEEVGGDVLLVVPDVLWAVVVVTRGAPGRLLAAVEAGGEVGGWAFLRRLGEPPGAVAA